MTNYNERLYEIFKEMDRDSFRYGNLETVSLTRIRAKQLITSLIKELAAEAKPYDKQGQIDIDSPAYNDGYYSGAYNAIEKFEQNLLKALEE